MNKMAIHFICDISSALQLRTTPQQLGGEKNYHRLVTVEQKKK